MRKINLPGGFDKSAKVMLEECCPCCKKSWVRFRVWLRPVESPAIQSFR